MVGPLSLNVEIVDVVPKLMARKLIEPALCMEKPVRLVCHEGKEKDLPADLALHNLDLVISDGLPKPGSVKTYNHFLGKCGITFFAEKSLAERLPEKFPDCLDNAPMVMPMTMS